MYVYVPMNAVPAEARRGRCIFWSWSYNYWQGELVNALTALQLQALLSYLAFYLAQTPISMLVWQVHHHVRYLPKP